jgi:uncharacterized protein
MPKAPKSPAKSPRPRKRRETARHARLEKALLALNEEAMLVDEFDGFVAGLLLCPELIKPGEWLSHVWGAGEGKEPVFENLDHVNAVLALVMEHYNDVAATLFERPDRYAPLFAVDPNSGEILWECWIEGFEKAVKLRPHAWRGCLDADRETAAAMSGLLMLADVARADPRFSEEEIDAITATAHGRIGDWVVTLNEWRLADNAPPNIPAPPAAPRPFSKVGRNDPCPCGSGKKYK